MPYQHHEPWDHLPIHLSMKMIIDPHSVIKEFYDVETDIVDLRKELKLWWRSAFSDKCLLSKPEMISLIGMRDHLLKMIDAAHVMHEKQNIDIVSMEESELLSSANFCGIPHEDYTAWDYFPRYLSRKEYINPHVMLSKFFAWKNLPEWRDILEELFSAAISECNIYGCSEDEDILKSTDYVIKLVEALYLIKVRFIDKQTILSSEIKD